MRRRPKRRADDSAVIRLSKQGRRIVGYNGKGKPAESHDRVTGFAYHPEDLPYRGTGWQGITKTTA